MTQAFVKTGQQRLLVTGFEIDDAAGEQAGLGQGRGEEILSCHAPQHLALVRAVIAAVNYAAATPSIAPLPLPATSCNAPRGRPPPASRQIPVEDLADAERQNDTAMGRRTGQALNALAQSLSLQRAGSITCS